MQGADNILACVDHSQFADYVTDYAAWAAQQLQTPLELLHIIDRQEHAVSVSDHSGAIGIGAQENLLDQLSNEDEVRGRAAREAGRELLTRLRERALSRGAVNVDIRQRYGELEDTLREQEARIDLMVLGRRGEAAQTTHRELGRNLERVVRALNKPVLSVSEPFREPQRVLFAFDGSSVTRRGIDMLAESTLLKRLPILLLMSGRPQSDNEKKLVRAQDKLTAAGIKADAEFIAGDPETVIANIVKARDIDLLIMGAYGHSPLRSALFGSKTTDLLRASRIPTLLLR